MTEAVKALMRTARASGGVVTVADCRRHGVAAPVMERLVKSGAFDRYHRGVYVLGGTPATQLTRARAALAALGPEAVLSHHSAAWAQGLVEREPREVHLTIPYRYRSSLGGVVVHRTRRPVAAVRFRSLRCTAVARTISDLARTVGGAELDAVVDRALAAKLVRVTDLVEAAVGPGRSAALRLPECLRRRGDLCGPDPSVLESWMGRLLIRFSLTGFEAELVAGPAGQYRIDFANRARRVAVEVFGYLWHHSPEQMARDLSRQRRLTLDGWKVLVFTWQDVLFRPAEVAAQIAAAVGLQLETPKS